MATRASVPNANQPKGKTMSKQKSVAKRKPSKAKLDAMANHLGKLKAEADKARAAYEEERNNWSALKLAEWETKLFRVTVTEDEVTCVDKDALIARLQPSRQLLRAMTKYAQRTTVRITSNR